MFPALLTAFLFACSGICGQRSADAVGPLRANLMRLTLAAIALGAVATLTSPVDWHSPAVPWLFVSGLVGFGAGDISLFLAYPHLGARLTLLINLCFAPVAGALGEWLLLGDRPTSLQMLFCLMIIGGVGVALGSRSRVPRSPSANFRIGLLAALGAGSGQGFGATLTRMAKHASAGHASHFTGISEAFVRVLPGLAFALAAWIFARWLPRRSAIGVRPINAPISAAGLRWVVGAAIFGPILGVSCFQWALGQAHSGVVLSIVATTPILVIPMAIVIEKDRPPPAAFIGSGVAVLGVILVLSVS